MTPDKRDRTLEIFFRAIRGEDLSVQELAVAYGVSTKSIGRIINDLKAFLVDHRELVGNTELVYSYQQRRYQLRMDTFLTNQELFALTEILIASRGLSRQEMLSIVDKLRRFTTSDDRPKLNRLLQKEIRHYAEVRHDCDSVEERLWQIVNCIDSRREITVDYYRADRSYKVHRLRPVSVLFSDFYFYLVAFEMDGNPNQPRYFRLDRIKRVVEHRETFPAADDLAFDEGLLRRRSLFMWPGKLRTIRFQYTGISVQAVLDKLPTAHIVEQCRGGLLLEAEVYGDGIKMWLLSQGSKVRVISPPDFVQEMKSEIQQMQEIYESEE